MYLAPFARWILDSRWLKRVLSLRKVIIAKVRHSEQPVCWLAQHQVSEFTFLHGETHSARPLELDTRGTSLTDFAQAICLQEQLEVSLVRLHITVQQLTFPLCLVAASGLRPQVRPRLGDIPAWPLRQIPSVLAQCSVDIPVALPCGPSQTTRTSRKRALSCMDPTLKFGQKCTASCCSGKSRAMLHLAF